MRIARYWDAAANAAKYGVVEGDIVRELAGHPYREIVKTNNERPLAATQLLAPCEPTKIIAGGANYHGHLKEVIAGPDRAGVLPEAADLADRARPAGDLSAARRRSSNTKASSRSW